MRLIDLDQRAISQHGLITLSQSGLSRAGWYRALKSGRFEQIHPGVARLAGTARGYRQRIAAALLAMAEPAVRNPSSASRPFAVASHRSAASLWLADSIPPAMSARSARSASSTDIPIDIIVADRRRSTRLAGTVVHRPRDLERLTPQVVDGIRCTNILRTLLDLGAVAPDEVHPLLGHALATRMVNLDAVETALLQHARPGRSGVTALRHALDDWAIDAKPADSVLEIAFRRLVTRFDLPAVEFHPVVEGWEVDFRFVRTRVLVECDGWATHGLQREQFERDRRRDADLTAAGWVVSRHSYRAITRDAATTAQRLQNLIAATGG